MDVSALSLGEEESLVFEEMDQTGTRTTGKLVLRFDGPLELRHLDLGRKVFRYPNGTLIQGMVPEAPFDTHFDLPWNVRIRFSTGVNDSECLLISVQTTPRVLIDKALCMLEASSDLPSLAIFDGVTITTFEKKQATIK